MQQLSREPGLEPSLREEAEALARFTERWLEDPRLENWWDKPILSDLKPPFDVAADSPLYPLADNGRQRYSSGAGRLAKTTADGRDATCREFLVQAEKPLWPQPAR